MIDALFVNSGILGQRTFASFVEREFVGERDGLRAAQVVLTDCLSAAERVMRRALCTRLWPDALAGIRNLDRYRFRAELNAGLLARGRIAKLEKGGRRFDVLHFHRQATAYASLRRMRRTPSIVSIDCTQACVVQRAATAAERQSYAANIRRDGQIFRAAKLIVSTSRWAAESVREMYPDCDTPIEVMLNPVLLDAFDAAWARERHARSSSPGYLPRVLFVGGEFARKGGPDLVAVWREGGLGRRARLDLVTHLPVPGADEAAGIHVHTGVRAHTPEWTALWRDADVFVLPTHDEAFGNVFQEAAAAGLPSIGTGINAIPEIVAAGETGLLVRPGNRGALAGALDGLIASAELRHEMGTRARRRVERTADPAAYRERLKALIHQVAGT